MYSIGGYYYAYHPTPMVAWPRPYYTTAVPPWTAMPPAATTTMGPPTTTAVPPATISRHEETQHDAQYTDLDCRACEGHFASRDAVVRHAHTAHHYCEDCDLAFHTGAGLYAHLRDDASDVHQTGTFACTRGDDSQCTARFATRAGRAMHRRAAHDAHTVACPLRAWTGCARTFVEEHDAARHVQLRGCSSSNAAISGRARAAMNSAADYLTLVLAFPALRGVEAFFRSPLRARERERPVQMPGYGYGVPEGRMVMAVCLVCPGAAHAPCGREYKTHADFLEHVFASHSVAEARVVARELFGTLLCEVKKRERVAEMGSRIERKY